MKANQTFKISSLIILNLIMGLTSTFGNCSSQLCLISQKHIPAVLKDTRDSHELFNFNCLQLRKLGKLSVPRSIYLVTTIPTLTILGMIIIAVYYKCKKRSGNIYRLASNRGKTRDTWVHCCASLYWGQR